MTTTPTLNGQLIGQAERATRALLDELLADVGTTFHRWVLLNVLTAERGGTPREGGVERLTTGLRVDRRTASDAVDDLVAAGLATGPDPLEPTVQGEELATRVRAGIATLTDRLYGDVPADDLATAGRVLATVTARANEALAG